MQTVAESAQVLIHRDAAWGQERGGGEIQSQWGMSYRVEQSRDGRYTGGRVGVAMEADCPLGTVETGHRC